MINKLNSIRSFEKIPHFVRNDNSGIFIGEEGKGQAKSAPSPRFTALEALVIPNGVRNLFLIFLAFDVYFLVQSLSTSWICNRLIINGDFGEKKYFVYRGSQLIDYQQDFFSCKRVGMEHTDNQAQYGGFVNDLGLNKKSATTVFLIFVLYFQYIIRQPLAIRNLLIISMKKVRKKIKIFIGLQLPEYQAQFLRLTTFDNLSDIQLILIFEK